MACSVCKEKGHDKRQCPIIRTRKEEERQDATSRRNAFINSPAFNTIMTASIYATGSQLMQRRGTWENFLGESLDLGLLVSGGLGMTDASLVLGALFSQIIDEYGKDFFNQYMQEIITTGGGSVISVDPETGQTEETFFWKPTGNGTII